MLSYIIYEYRKTVLQELEIRDVFKPPVVDLTKCQSSSIRRKQGCVLRTAGQRTVQTSDGLYDDFMQTRV
jgi:hypothetical protein